MKSKFVVPIGKSKGKYVKTEVKPVAGGYMILVTFDNGERDPFQKSISYYGDTGVDNFVTVANNVDAHFLLKAVLLNR